MVIGSHLSIAGGLDRAITTASEYGFDAVALFLRNQRQWRSPPLSEETVQKFRLTRKRKRSPVEVRTSPLGARRRRGVEGAMHDNVRTGHRGHRVHRGKRDETFSVSSVTSVAEVAL